MSSPMLAPLRSIASRLPSDRFPTIDDLCGLLDARANPICTHSGATLRYVAPRVGLEYERHIYLTGEVPTRSNNVHDLFNAMVWMAYPKAKAAVNALHVKHMALRESNTRLRSTAGKRGVARDLLTLLDESGAVVACSDPSLLALLRNFDWKALFCDRRRDVQERFRCYLFGHGTCEKCLTPFVGLTANAVPICVAEDFFSASLAEQLIVLDDALCDWLAEPRQLECTRRLQPLPLLGIPGWHNDNRMASFYDNTGYFRPGRGGANFS